MITSSDMLFFVHSLRTKHNVETPMAELFVAQAGDMFECPCGCLRQYEVPLFGGIQPMASGTAYVCAPETLAVLTEGAIWS